MARTFVNMTAEQLELHYDPAGGYLLNAIKVYRGSDGSPKARICAAVIPKHWSQEFDLAAPEVSELGALYRPPNSLHPIAVIDDEELWPSSTIAYDEWTGRGAYIVQSR
ncbi:hypothetical protein [Rhizobium leguminosarum]|uniref:hypothetical protein n=1 Tax=Rhizobium leguminosarum TaxID=384 RepID=UPI001611B5FA|nr:hypothetical protein [Rhizobium leguminosarum]MBB4326964.1 hypothetical protein [Rhizobium leguminosarum]MBB4352629.1 hypothetical protein [Rhizobium leguminosarum]MBB4547278.1 hypothetical protein [Rhizobium leguminosarum]MBB4559730.1 hypothetical protein [Rhizobium leguminosarum]